MFTPSFSRLFTLCAALASMGVTFASPLTRRGVIPEGPKFVVYSDLPVSQDVLPPLDQIQGFNVVYVCPSLPSWEYTHLVGHSAGTSPSCSLPVHSTKPRPGRTSTPPGASS